jgi:hypothetical protein
MAYLYLLIVVWVVLQVFWPANFSNRPVLTQMKPPRL